MKAVETLFPDSERIRCYIGKMEDGLDKVPDTVRPGLQWFARGCKCIFMLFALDRPPVPANVACRALSIATRTVPRGDNEPERRRGSGSGASAVALRHQGRIPTA